MKKSGPRKSRRVLLGLALVGALGAGGYAARELAWPAIKAARVERMNRDARAFLVADDPGNALLTARKSLLATNRNPEAWRIAATAAAARDQSDAVWYQENLCREQPTVENRLEFFRLALRFNVPAYATDILNAMSDGTNDAPEFHRLAATIRRRTGRAGEARVHLTALVRLAPDDLTARMELAEMELAADPERLDKALRARVLALADEPEIGARALTLLLREKVAARDPADAVGTAALTRRLRRAEAPDFATRLLVVEALVQLSDPDATGQLERLRSEIAEQPAQVAALIALLVRVDRAAEVAPWVAVLPAETRAAEPVQRETAEALLALGDASALEALLREARWPEREYLRAALLAHAYRAQGRAADFASTWRLALISTGSNRAWIFDLLTRADAWRWTVERHEVIWKLFMLEPANTALQQALVLWERHRGDTAALRRLFTRVVEVSPEDAVARNNLAYTSLLLDLGAAQADLQAAELASAYPENPYYATTHALALLKRGEAAAALARLDALTPAQRTEPVRELLRALCLLALGRAEPAAGLLDGLILAELLPEERALAAEARASLARQRRAAGNQARLFAMDEDAATASGWLAEVDAPTRDAATTEMRLADSLFAAADWEGLRALLEAGAWPGGEHLRFALRAHALRRVDRARESHEAWRQALALAGRDGARLLNLAALAARWEWASERIETLNLVLEGTPGDRRVLDELLAHYRAARRTPELLRVLGLHLGATPGANAEAVAHAYYSLLLDSHVARAEVTARAAFDAAPDDATRRMVQAFALLRQHRAAEALALLDGLPEAEEALRPVPLLRAAVLVRLGDAGAARLNLARFDLASALPEEAALAERLARQLADPTPSRG